MRNKCLLGPNVVVCALIVLGMLTVHSKSEANPIQVDPAYDPVQIYTPLSYDGATSLPLIITLHGYSQTAQGHSNYFSFLPYMNTYNFIYAFPEGRLDSNNFAYWAANDWCCAQLGAGLDDESDSNYLIALIREIQRQFSVDSDRIYVMGHSNGGAMAIRMACDHSETIAGIMSLAGANYYDETLCNPTQPVHFLYIHGTDDQTVNYNGGVVTVPPIDYPYPSAAETVGDLLGYNDCRTPQAAQFIATIDIDLSSLGNETTVLKYPLQCQFASSVEFWSGNGMGHGPDLSGSFQPAVLDWFYAHPKQQLRFVDKDTITWPAQIEADSYNMYSGPIGSLDGSDYGTCLTDLDGDDTNTTYVDTSVPTPGQGYSYVMSYVSGFLEGGIGRTDAGVSRPQSNPPCP